MCVNVDQQDFPRDLTMFLDKLYQETTMASMETLRMLQKHPSRFTASIAPTSRAKCRVCKQVIKAGSLRVSRDIPTNFTGDTGMIVHHYHFDHGMQAATRVRCTSEAPSFGVATTLTSVQARKTKMAGKIALNEWKKRCKNHRKR